MSTKTIWLVIFMLSFLSLSSAILFRSGIIQRVGVDSSISTSQRQTDFISELNKRPFPNFWVYSQNGDKNTIFEFIKGAKTLILFLGPGCQACDDQAIGIFCEFERAFRTHSDLQVIIVLIRGINEFLHLRMLTSHDFSGIVLKCDENIGNELYIPKYPSLFLLDNNSQRILNVHFPKADGSKQLYEFLKKVVK